MDLEIKSIRESDRDYPVLWSARCAMEYKTLTGESWPSMDSPEKTIQAFYCAAKAGGRLKGERFDYSYEEFLEMVDAYYLDILMVLPKALFGKATEEPGGDGKKQ